MRVGKVRVPQRYVIAGAAVLVLALAGVGFSAWPGRPAAKSNKSFANVTAAIARFQPYQLELLDGFAVNYSTLNYSNDVLIFQLQNNLGQKAAVTEQPLPDPVADGIDPNATQVAGVDGKAIVTYNGTTTTGALFSSEHNGVRTMVLIHTSDPISQSTIEDMLRGLRPTR